MDAFCCRAAKRFPQDIGKGRPCLNAHIGKCMAVCSGKITCELTMKLCRVHCA